MFETCRRCHEVHKFRVQRLGWNAHIPDEKEGITTEALVKPSDAEESAWFQPQNCLLYQHPSVVLVEKVVLRDDVEREVKDKPKNADNSPKRDRGGMGAKWDRQSTKYIIRGIGCSDQTSENEKQVEITGKRDTDIVKSKIKGDLTFAERIKLKGTGTHDCLGKAGIGENAKTTNIRHTDLGLRKIRNNVNTERASLTGSSDIRPKEGQEGCSSLTRVKPVSSKFPNTPIEKNNSKKARETSAPNTNQDSTMDASSGQSSSKTDSGVLRRLELDAESFFEFLFSNRWEEGCLLRVLSGKLLENILHILTLLERFHDVISYVTMAYIYNQKAVQPCLKTVPKKTEPEVIVEKVLVEFDCFCPQERPVIDTEELRNYPVPSFPCSRSDSLEQIENVLARLDQTSVRTEKESLMCKPSVSVAKEDKIETSVSPTQETVPCMDPSLVQSTSETTIAIAQVHDENMISVKPKEIASDSLCRNGAQASSLRGSASLDSRTNAPSSGSEMAICSAKASFDSKRSRNKENTLTERKCFSVIPETSVSDIDGNELQASQTVASYSGTRFPKINSRRSSETRVSLKSKTLSSVKYDSGEQSNSEMLRLPQIVTSVVKNDMFTAETSSGIGRNQLSTPTSVLPKISSNGMSNICEKCLSSMVTLSDEQRVSNSPNSRKSDQLSEDQRSDSRRDISSKGLFMHDIFIISRTNAGSSALLGVKCNIRGITRPPPHENCVTPYHMIREPFLQRRHNQRCIFPTIYIPDLPCKQLIADPEMLQKPSDDDQYLGPKLPDDTEMVASTVSLQMIPPTPPALAGSKKKTRIQSSSTSNTKQAIQQKDEKKRGRKKTDKDSDTESTISDEEEQELSPYIDQARQEGFLKDVELMSKEFTVNPPVSRHKKTAIKSRLKKAMIEKWMEKHPLAFTGKDKPADQATASNSIQTDRQKVLYTDACSNMSLQHSALETSTPPVEFLKKWEKCPGFDEFYRYLVEEEEKPNRKSQVRVSKSERSKTSQQTVHRTEGEGGAGLTSAKRKQAKHSDRVREKSSKTSRSRIKDRDGKRKKSGKAKTRGRKNIDGELRGTARQKLSSKMPTDSENLDRRKRGRSSELPFSFGKDKKFADMSSSGTLFKGAESSILSSGKTLEAHDLAAVHAYTRIQTAAHQEEESKSRLGQDYGRACSVLKPSDRIFQTHQMTEIGITSSGKHLLTEEQEEVLPDASWIMGDATPWHVSVRFAFLAGGVCDSVGVRNELLRRKNRYFRLIEEAKEIIIRNEDLLVEHLEELQIPLITTTSLAQKDETDETKEKDKTITGKSRLIKKGKSGTLTQSPTESQSESKDTAHHRKTNEDRKQGDRISKSRSAKFGEGRQRKHGTARIGLVQSSKMFRKDGLQTGRRRHKPKTGSLTQISEESDEGEYGKGKHGISKRTAGSGGKHEDDGKKKQKSRESARRARSRYGSEESDTERGGKGKGRKRKQGKYKSHDESDGSSGDRDQDLTQEEIDQMNQIFNPKILNSAYSFEKMFAHRKDEIPNYSKLLAIFQKPFKREKKHVIRPSKQAKKQPADQGVELTEELPSKPSTPSPPFVLGKLREFNFLKHRHHMPGTVKEHERLKNEMSTEEFCENLVLAMEMFVVRKERATTTFGTCQFKSNISVTFTKRTPGESWRGIPPTIDSRWMVAAVCQTLKAA